VVTTVHPAAYRQFELADLGDKRLTVDIRNDLQASGSLIRGELR
jgi:hypothetical protein